MGAAQLIGTSISHDKFLEKIGEGGMEQISTEGGREPLWGHEENELFFSKWEYHDACFRSNTIHLERGTPKTFV